MSSGLLAFADYVARKASKQGIPLMREDVFNQAERFGVCLTDRIWSEIKYRAKERGVSFLN